MDFLTSACRPKSPKPSLTDTFASTAVNKKAFNLGEPWATLGCVIHSQMTFIQREALIQ